MFGVKSFYVFSMKIDIYTFLNVLGFFVALAYNLIVMNEKKQNLSFISQRIMASRANTKGFVFLVLFLETFALTSFLFFPGVGFNKLMGYLTDGADNYFGFAYFGPIPLLLVCIPFRIKPLKQLDLYTPAYPLSLATFKLACSFAGCCYGVEAEHGIFMPDRGRVEVPIQLIELGVALAMVVFLILIRKKIKRGGMFPLYLMTYSATRFVTEFWRGDFPALFGKCTIYHIFCMIGMVVGAALFTLAWFKGEAFDALFDKSADKKEEEAEPVQ